MMRDAEKCCLATPKGQIPIPVLKDPQDFPELLTCPWNGGIIVLILQLM